jgi:hypothetical protein
MENNIISKWLFKYGNEIIIKTKEKEESIMKKDNQELDSNLIVMYCAIIFSVIISIYALFQ